MSLHIINNSYNPAIIKKSIQAVTALNRPSKEDEPFFYTPLGIMIGMAAPVKPRDYKIDGLAYRAFRSVNRSNQQLWQITNRLSSPAGLAPGEAAEMYQDRVNAASKIWSETYALAEAYKSLGMPAHQVARVAVDAGLSRSRVQMAMRGVTDRPTFPDDKLADIRKIDPARYAELVDAIRKQARIIRVD